MSEGKGNRVVVLGLDGFPYTLMRGFVQRGIAPCMAKLLDRGTMVQMDSVFPTVSSVAWTAFATGKNPGKFGVFGFTEVNHNLQINLPTSKEIRCETIWEIASAAGKRVIGLGVPLTYPPRHVNGILVSDFLAPRLEGAVHPPEILGKLRQNGYQIDIDPLRARQSPEFISNEMPRILEARRRTTLDIFDTEPWDLLVCHVIDTDRINHFLWKHLLDEEAEYHSFVMDFYKSVDSFVGDVASRLDDRTTLLLMSDHGFCPTSHEVQLNGWLEQQAYLKVGPDGTKGFGSIAPGSRAFAQVPGRIHILRAGHWRMGSVSAEQAPPLINEIIAELRFWTDPESGQPVCRKVMTRDEAFHGPYLDTAPDIIIDPADGYDFKASFEGKALFTSSPISGMHTHWDAMLYVSDHPISDRQPWLPDISATILDLLGIPVPADWDGRSILAHE